MQLGIKVGPQPQSIDDLDRTQPSFVEVWYNSGKQQEYEKLFSELKIRKIQAGLHFWGRLDSGIWANIGHTDKTVTEGSMNLFRSTIDTAAQHGFVYVNMHPSCRSLVKINFDTESFERISEPIAYEESEKIFLENYAILDQYSKDRNVVLTLETIPSKLTNGWRTPNARLQPIDLFELRNATVVKASTMGFTVANDFGHTAASVTSANRQEIWELLWSMTNTLCYQTRLLHLGFIVPPYNGTDFHSHFDTEIFDTNDAVPKRSELLELLTLFRNRDDVWALAEPDGRHPENYFFVKNLLNDNSHSG